MAKYRLFNRLGSGGFAVQATLATAEIAFDYEPIVSRPSEPIAHQLGDLNSWGQVPVLELTDGSKLTEVAAILTYLAHAEPALSNGPNLWVDHHGLHHRWCVFLAVNVYEAILRRSYTERYFEDPSQIGPDGAKDLPDDIVPLITSSLRRAATARMHDAFRCIESGTAGHRYLLGDRMSPCDIFLAMLYAWHNQKPDLPKCTWIATQVATHPTIRPIWRQNFERFLDFKWHEL